MAILNAESAELTALLKDKPQRHNIGAEIGINVFIALTTISHCLGVKVECLAVNPKNAALLTDNSFSAGWNEYI